MGATVRAATTVVGQRTLSPTERTGNWKDVRLTLQKVAGGVARKSGSSPLSSNFQPEAMISGVTLLAPDLTAHGAGKRDLDTSHQS